MSAADPTTITRTLFTNNRVHVYPIPPLKSIAAGHRASEWGIDRESSRIFTAKLRVIETTTLLPSSSSFDEEERKITTDVRLEDPNSGELFANCPYTGAACVEPVLDSSRFFAVRVVDGNRKAYLGIGFEDRGAAFDFGVCLQEVRRHNGLDVPAGEKKTNGKGGAAGDGGGGLGFGDGDGAKKDYSLKEGETIKITIGVQQRTPPPFLSPSSASLSSTSAIPPLIPPPPSTSFSSSSSSANSTPFPLLPPPPSADEEKKRRRESYKLQHHGGKGGSGTGQQDLAGWGAFETTSTTTQGGRGGNMGFDDDPFGDFV
ncbi:hypothetical protein BDZ91DRAFT_796019 [Kalaharituber pfeilii]|nr:hypothetical protein BDZ91DRAFT_796019 [Kalaharituber pfeilii]